MDDTAYLQVNITNSSGLLLFIFKVIQPEYSGWEKTVINLEWETYVQTACSGSIQFSVNILYIYPTHLVFLHVDSTPVFDCKAYRDHIENRVTLNFHRQFLEKLKRLSSLAQHPFTVWSCYSGQNGVIIKGRLRGSVKAVAPRTFFSQFWYFANVLGKVIK